ncbi:poly [ADP-ribose] polymerase 4-like [Pomacea canaliculata]|uniref:poly [ADP-ribose] polymerase 4-like n=1 Tax=Pomacea canaliculata TaxID=400727 RepID=UPI000D73C624|nr:poly [ADP-ribose] polymerase 4-like [Pomacea canaliculata]XP_025097287.1 poly [ADP-ribose] polymerase 4-like [Pomacea canaliculata]XP_025097288.1 poly [ADP-ribose] polymerase 4-like [Pomacea canaliculata]
MSVFDNCQIALDLGINVGFKKKVELRKAITENGGVVSYIVTQKCSFVVASDPEKCDVSSKCRMALKYCLPVVSMDYIWDSLCAGKRLAIDQYAIAGKSKGLDFRSGKISALKKQDTKTMSRHTIKPHFNIRNVKVWQAGDPDEPHFDENFEIAKYAVFQGQNKKQDLTTFYSLEIHVGSNAGKKENGNAERQYRLYSHFGNLTDAVAGNPCKTEIYHVANADQALAGFATLYSAQMKDHKMQKVESTVLRNVGSRKLQQILTELESEVGVASREVQNLTEHIWLEAIGEVEAVLASTISSVKVEEVEKAEALLVKIRDALGKEVDGDVTSLVKEFYSTLPHKSEDGGSMKPSRAWLSKKQDLCQLIRDMVSVSEATSWSARSSAQAKYRALRCNISYLEPGTQEHKQIMEDVVSSINKKMTINITNIYAVQRPIEDAHFQHDMDNKRHLFHSSKVENFLGILSRGLLLPKVVADDFGGTRTDAGMLGCGIYFASDASKSALYSTPSKTKGTRLLLVNEVALGQCYDYTAIDTTLTKPPEGYNSVHGVGKKNDNSSHFEDDEYVVYSVNQQRLRYLVEFTINQEQPRSMVTLDNVLMETEDLVSMESCEIDLHDVQNVRDPVESVKLGLVVENQEGLVELKSVHVRAKLVDLAAQVTVLQEYVNNSMYPVEAKYVFPLGDGAAVCGFEAFINDKHIVGEVKEKETAHREYKQAISEGHGAYLMDQDEETPDVFTVSVGNLPPGATVLIKITYVAELQVEEEIISFRLPGSVAPWKKESAGKEKTQDKTKTFKLSSGQVSIQVAVEMPFDIKSLVCPTHFVRMKKTATKAVIELKPGQDIQEGFQILIGLAEIHVPRMWVERHPDQPDHEACMLTFYPEFEVGSEVSSELVLLLDVSNSMKGASLQSAKKLAKLILLTMDASWKFNVVVFGTRYSELFPCARPKNETTLQEAEKFVQQAQADMGNTEVFRPLHAYFLLPPANQALRNVFLISDGHLNNESSVLKDASNNYHHTRIFTFGVSSSCNAYSLRALARISAGSFEFFDTKVKSKWEEKVKGQLRKAGQPGLTSVRVDWRQYDDNLPPPVQAPCRITALFSGARQVIYGFVPNCTMAFLSAVVGGQEVSTVVSTSDLAITTGLVVHRLTARALIQDWETGMLSDDRTHHEVVRMDENRISLS